jgi:hypothetical protein
MDSPSSRGVGKFEGMRATLGVLVLLIVAGLVGTLVGRSTAPASTMATTQQAAADAGMDRSVPEVDFHDSPLNDVIDALAKQTCVNVMVKWGVLENAGVGRSTPITLRLHNQPLRRILDFVCGLAGGETVKLRAEADDGVIVLSTAEDLARAGTIRIYDVRDLLEADSKRYAVATAPSNSTGQQQATSSAGLFSGATGNPCAESADKLTRLIQDMVAPDSWRDNGGTIGSIHEFDGVLVISSTPEGHTEIADLFAKLRKRN